MKTTRNFFTSSYILFAILIVYNICSSGQSVNINSPNDDTSKVNTLNNLAFNYVGIAIDSALLFAQQAYALAVKSDFKKGIGDGLNNIGLVYYYQSDFPKALDFFSQSLKIRETLGIKSDLAFTLMGIGNVYDSKGDYDKALNFLLRALKIREEIKDSIGLAKTLNNIGIIYWRQSDMDKALEYHQQALSIRQKIGDRTGIAYSLGNIGNVYLDKSEKTNDSVELNLALSYFTQAFRILKDTFPDGSTLGDIYSIAVSLNNIGSVLDRLKKHEEAIDYYLQSLKIREQADDKDGIITCLVNIGTIYNKTGKFKKSLEYINHALKISKEINSKDALKSCYDALSYVYANLKDYKQAYEYHQLFSQMKDSLFNEESSKQIAEMQTKYDTEKKEQQIKLLNKDKEIQSKDLERQKTIRNAVVGGLFMVLFFSFVLINRLLLIRKQKKVIEIEREKSEKLLLNILPKEIAEELKINNSVTPQFYKLVTVMFTDFKGFTTIAEKMSAEELVSELDFIFKKFDEIISKYPIEKIKTIGDAYMCAGGLPIANTTNPLDLVLAALDICEFMKSRQLAVAVGNENQQPTANSQWQVRIGIHTGSVIAGVVGDKKFAYDIWGDTVNTASRMESSGEPNKVNISGSTYNLIKDHLHTTNYQLQTIFRGKIPAKNKGEIEMYFVDRK